jgi:hypothetical protein
VLRLLEPLQVGTERANASSRSIVLPPFRHNHAEPAAPNEVAPLSSGSRRRDSQPFLLPPAEVKATRPHPFAVQRPEKGKRRPAATLEILFAQTRTASAISASVIVISGRDGL